MEPILLYLMIVGTATTICAIDESIDWLESYYREGREDLKGHINKNDPHHGIYYHE